MDFQSLMQYCVEYVLSDLSFFQSLLEPASYYLFSQLVFFWLVFIFVRFTWGYKPRIVTLILGVIWSTFPFLNLLSRSMLTVLVGIEWQMAGYVLVRFMFPGAKWHRSMFIWFVAECLSNILSHFLGMMIGDMLWFGEMIVAVVVGVCFCGIFVSPLRHKLRDLLATTPNWAMIYAMVVMYVVIMLHQFMVPGGYVQSMFSRLAESGSLFITCDHPDCHAWAQQFSEQIALGVLNAMNAFYQKIYPLLLEILLCVAFVVFMIASRSNKILKQQNELFEKQIEAQAEHYRNLAAANAEVRRFRHDFKNVRFALEKLLAEGKKTEALAVMQEFSEALDSKNRYMILFDTGNGIADALLTDKLHRAQEKDASISFKGAIPAGAPAPTDLCVLLGNSIDNAIEACEKLPEDMERKITVECNCSSGFLFLTIRNPIAKPVAICDNRVFTTKKDNALHGFGISSMHKAAKKYDGTVKLDAQGGYFTVNVDLCLPAQTTALAG